MLDQCWDLLRQRQARRTAGRPRGARVRDEDCRGYSDLTLRANANATGRR
jgi:hypothetical protein